MDPTRYIKLFNNNNNEKGKEENNKKWQHTYEKNNMEDIIASKAYVSSFRYFTKVMVIWGPLGKKRDEGIFLEQMQTYLELR